MVERFSYDFDVVLLEIGKFGRYQQLLVFAALWSMIPIGGNLSAGVFLSFNEEFRCYIPSIDDVTTANASGDDVLQAFLPPSNTSDQVYSSCQQYDYAPSCNSTSCATPHGSLNVTDGGDVITCRHGYRYARKVFRETTATEWNLVCGMRGMNSLSTALFCFGMLLGSLVGGVIADRYGRVRTMACGSACSVLLGCCCAFSPNFYVFIALRFLIGACTVSILISLSVYTVEIVGQEWRPFVGLQFGVFSGVGYMYLALLGYFLRHWRHLQLALSCSFLPFLFFAYFLPESPRLLFARGEIARGKKVCRRMSERNGNRKFNKGIWSKAEIVEDCAKTYSPRELFEEKSLLRLLLSSTVLYFVNSLVFFCLSFNVGAWSGSPFLNQFLSGLVESVACVAFVPVVSRLGRRWTNVVCLLLAGCLMIAMELLKLLLPARDWVYSLETGILLIAKFCISGSFNMLFMYIAELFPTHLRNTATGVASAGARLASVISPFLIMIHSNFHWIFAVVLGLLSIATSVLAHFCPETKGIPMFATTRDAINFYKYGKAAKPCSISSNNGPDALNNNRTDFVTSLIIDDDDGAQSTGLSDDKSSTERSSQYDEKDAMI